MLTDAPGSPGTDLSSLRRIAYGAAPMGETQLLRAIEGLGCGFLGVYGMTETAGTVVALAPADHDPGGPRAGCSARWASVAVAGRRVVDPVTMEDAPTGGVGEIWVRSGQNTVGYWNQTAASPPTRCCATGGCAAGTRRTSTRKASS